MNPDLVKPEGLSPGGHAAYDAVVRVLRARRATSTGGCTAFHTPAAWAARGEQYGGNSLLVVVYDGGDVARFFRMGDDDRAYEAMRAALAAVGCFAEECTGWYSAIYAIR
jgi:hypothetical protein